MTFITAPLVGLSRLVCVVSLCYGLKRLNEAMSEFEGPSPAGGLFKFFTVWTVLIALAFYSVCILCEVFSYLKFNTEKFSFRGLVFHSLVFPFSVSVFLLYWGISLYDATQLHPVNKHLPDHVNQILHTLPLVSAVIESLFYFHPLPPRKVALRLYLGVSLAYCFLIAYDGIKFNTWTYVFLQKLPQSYKFLALSVILFSTSFVYLIGETLHLLVWREHLKDE